MSILKQLLEEKIKRERLSEREASRQIGISAITVGRALKGEVVDVDTLILICSWLNVSPSYVLDGYLGGDTTLGSKVAAIIESNPKLAEIFGDMIDHVEDGVIDAETLRDIAAYSVYKIKLEKHDGKRNKD